ncbi:hypothetical protein KBI52_04540 [Microvirga sp. HBU67558]|uniref:hypothetical protein n=1 Tax=Microvirga TaxID=186650 RepID=UPI001B393195|nr:MULTISPECIES: hypothetical protein [unclassified Microvirga]MBQ0819491.1 hypothetical protein [Microvirga sp. HBU67558]
MLVIAGQGAVDQKVAGGAGGTVLAIPGDDFDEQLVLRVRQDCFIQRRAFVKLAVLEIVELKMSFRISIRVL